MSIRVITVVEPMYFRYAPSSIYPEAMLEAERDYRKYMRTLIDKKVSELTEKFPKAKITGEILEGNAAASIIDEAMALCSPPNHGWFAWSQRLRKTCLAA